MKKGQVLFFSPSLYTIDIKGYFFRLVIERIRDKSRPSLAVKEGEGEKDLSYFMNVSYIGGFSKLEESYAIYPNTGKGTIIWAEEKENP